MVKLWFLCFPKNVGCITNFHGHTCTCSIHENDSIADSSKGVGQTLLMKCLISKLIFLNIVTLGVWAEYNIFPTNKVIKSIPDNFSKC